jgi:hypothetical protein
MFNFILPRIPFKYILGSFKRRRLTTGITILGIALVVFVFASPAFGVDLVATPDEVPALSEPPSLPPGFETMSGINLDVHGHPDEAALLLHLAQHGNTALPELARRMGVPVGGRVQVYLARTDAEFHALQPGRQPEWADATAWPELGVIFLRSPMARGSSARPIETVLDHEIVHVLLGRAFVPHDPPRWLQEGMAQVMSGEYSPATTRDLAHGMLGGLYSLEELHDGFPRGAAGARTAYAQSADLVAWIHAEHGEAAMQRLVRELARTGDIDGALRSATGAGLQEADLAWRARLDRGAPLWLSALASEETLWMAVGFLGLAAVVRGRMRLRARFARLASEELARDALLEGLWRDATGGGSDQTLDLHERSEGAWGPVRIH